MQLKISQEVSQWFVGKEDIFAEIMALDGEVFRKVKGRETLRFTKNGKSYFIKKHFGTSWRELWKNLLQLRLPVFGARQEWLAIKKLEQLNLATMTTVGFGERGCNPLTRESFIITEELQNIWGLRDIAINWQAEPLPFTTKQNLIKAVAKITRTLHNNGVNHRDLYLAHLLLDKKSQAISLIDLHRAQIRKQVPERWLIKDLAALYFSAQAVLTQRDTLRFLSYYFAAPWREIIKSKQTILAKIAKKAAGLREEDETTEIQNWHKYIKISVRATGRSPLLDNPDKFISEGKLLTGEDTCAVAHIKLVDHDLVLKRYNRKNLWHGVNRLFRQSRAARCWQNAEMLLAHEIATPNPLAMIEKRFGPLRSTAYLITEYIAGETVLDYFRACKDLSQAEPIAQQLIEIFRKLRHHNIRHGDTKASNFIISGGKIYLIDLDGMRQYSAAQYIRTQAFAKDKARFMRNWHDLPEVSKLFATLYAKVNWSKE